MPRTAQPRTPNAGEVVSFFEELPLEFARAVLDICQVRVQKRTAERDRKLQPSRVVVVQPRKRGRPRKVQPEAEQAG